MTDKEYNQEPEQDTSSGMIRSLGWELDCWLIQTLAAEKGVPLTCKDYLYGRFSKKNDYNKEAVKHFLQLSRSPLKKRDHIITRAGVNNDYQPIKQNVWTYEMFEFE